eukprot:11442592-Alexandrium_andersonii.AAC.1
MSHPWGGSTPAPWTPSSASGMPAGLFRYQIRHLRETRRRAHPFRALGIKLEAVPWSMQFKLRTSKRGGTR